MSATNHAATPISRINTRFKVPINNVAAIPTVTWNKERRNNLERGKSSLTTSANGSSFGLTACQDFLLTMKGSFIF